MKISDGINFAIQQALTDDLEKTAAAADGTYDTDAPTTDTLRKFAHKLRKEAGKAKGVAGKVKGVAGEILAEGAEGTARLGADGKSIVKTPKLPNFSQLPGGTGGTFAPKK